MAKKISELGQDKIVIYRSKDGYAEIEVKLEKIRYGLHNHKLLLFLVLRGQQLQSI